MTALEIVETGEIVEMMTSEQASSVTTQISLKLDVIADNYESVLPLMRQAITRQAHVALGYASPGAYVADRFGKTLSRLGVEMRREVVRELSSAGLSTRAIAPVFDVTHKTIVKDLQVVPEVPPGDVTVIPAQQFAKLVESDEPEDAPGLRAAVAARSVDAPEPEPEPVKITGIDGKTYTPSPKPARTAPYRKPLPDVAKTAGFEFRQSMDRVLRVFEDNRYRQNEEQVANALRGHLLYVAETVAAVIDQLPN